MEVLLLMFLLLFSLFRGNFFLTRLQGDITCNRSAASAVTVGKHDG
jgi:hypothetical protein